MSGGSDSELSDLGPEYDDGDEVMHPSSDDDDEDVDMDQGMMSDDGSERLANAPKQRNFERY